MSKKGVERGRKGRQDSGDPRQLVRADLEDHVADRLPLEGIRPREHPEEDHPRRPDVAARIELARAASLLGAHVLRRAEEHAALRRFLRAEAVEVHGLDDPEVEQLHRLLSVTLGQENVARLEIAVDEPRRVRAHQAAPDLAQDLGRFVNAQSPDALEALGEVLPVEQLHHDVRQPFLDAVVVDLDDVVAPELRGRERLALEALPRLGHLREILGHDLHGDGAAELLIAPQPDGPHPPARHLALEAVSPGHHGRRQRFAGPLSHVSYWMLPLRCSWAQPPDASKSTTR